MLKPGTFVCTYKITVHVFVQGINKSVTFNHFCFHSNGINKRKFMISHNTMPWALREKSAVMYKSDILGTVDNCRFLGFWMSRFESLPLLNMGDHKGEN
jgi:hypothetical protein